MVEQKLNEQLDRVAQRAHRLRLSRGLSICWLVAALAGAGILLAAPEFGDAIRFAFAGLVSSALAAALVVMMFTRRQDDARLQAARAIELTYPELDDRLLAASEQQPSVDTARFSFLQQQVIGEALQHAADADWRRAVPSRTLFRASMLHLLTLCLFASVCGLLYEYSPPVKLPTTMIGNPKTDTAQTVDYGITVEPGDASVERGTSLLVLARFAKQMPASVALVIHGSSHASADESDLTDESVAAGEADAVDPPGETGRRRIPLTKSLDDPVFGGRIARIDRDVTYHIEFDSQRSQGFQITTFDFPQLVRADATVTFPEYTGTPEASIKDTQQVSLVTGSKLTWKCMINKPIKSARLIADDESSIVLKPPGERHDIFLAEFTPKHSMTYRLELLDGEDRKNKYPPEFQIDVLPNRPPDLKLAFPARDLRVSPIEEVPVEATAWDDFGIKEFGLVFTLAEKPPRKVVLGQDAAAKEEHKIAHLLSFEELNAEPNQLVSYYFFADDFGPDGKIRHTFSDMYFAEVRHFEEIFREGPQMPSGAGKQQAGGGKNAKKAEELAKSQKEIINATWKIIRREISKTPTPEFKADTELLTKSQQAILDKVRQLEAKLTDAKSKSLVTAVVTHMTKAAETLAEASGKNQIAPLTPALAAEQAAYQALLKLRAREHKVSKSQKSGGGKGASGNRSQQQLQQLELSNKKNRYESQQSASKQQAKPANREQLQVLNRLRELSQRQNDMNQKLKEAEHALRNAKTEQEKEELQRQLKRLRDEQQQLLRDLDKVRNRMDRPENQRQMADSRKQLDQTRDKVRQASEALKQGQLSKALNSGTRAERELQQLRDDFRKKTAGQFGDAMQNLREQARELAERQNN